MYIIYGYILSMHIVFLVIVYSVYAKVDRCSIKCINRVGCHDWYVNMDCSGCDRVWGYVKRIILKLT